MDSHVDVNASQGEISHGSYKADQRKGYRRFSKISTAPGMWATQIILQNDFCEIWTTLDLWLLVISQSTDNYYSALSVFP